MINMKFDVQVKKNKEIYSNNEIFKTLSLILVRQSQNSNVTKII